MVIPRRHFLKGLGACVVLAPLPSWALRQFAPPDYFAAIRANRSLYEDHWRQIASAARARPRTESHRLLVKVLNAQMNYGADHNWLSLTEEISPRR